MYKNRERVKELTICIHGVWSDGDGFDPLVSELHQDDAFPYRTHRVKVYDHGVTMPWHTWSEGNREKLADAIGGYYHKQLRKYPYVERVNVLAHSYGSWGITHYLRNVEATEANLDTLITVGSVVPKDYPWRRVIKEKEMVDKVFNFISRHDMVSGMGWLTGLGTGGDYFWSNLFGQDVGYEQDVQGAVENYCVDGWHSWYSSEAGVEFLRGVLLNNCKWVGRDLGVDTA